MTKNIKWCAIQPLTGGMYLGAEKVIGHPAEFILSYPGVGDPKYDKEHNLICGGNEYHLMKYLDKVNRRPEYKVFNRKMFQNDNDMNPEIINSELWTKNPDKELDYLNMDLCVAVPVCSGLSTATTGSQEAKDARNCNMLWIAKYALRVIQPKIYIFENAPTFMGIRGEHLRTQFEALAKETGYSIAYYKTDTQFHDNAQTRKRTFVIFFKLEYTPDMGFEKIQTTLGEYFGRLPQDIVKKEEDLDMEFVNCVNYYIIGYLKEKFGDNWRKEVEPDIFKYIISHNLWNEVLEFTARYNSIWPQRKAYMIHFVDHFNMKISQGKGVFHSLPNMLKEDGVCPAVMFKMVQSCLHPKEDRLLNMRELLHLMGLPNDFEMQGDKYRAYAQIGQNVPVRTAFFIVSEALKAYDSKINKDKAYKNVRYFNNIKQQEIEKW